ncbi:hypothetical protein GGX14DRAFT_575274 [Mycena pura]|uniref:Uncharacterized protein n=1 Tax=Mycena pura TaxID=153505 RepID=A0AAD6UZG5_9AGAR|nr:hypothetical protein GGX14DRAFT_575274 [Mycena pura]
MSSSKSTAPIDDLDIDEEYQVLPSASEYWSAFNHLTIKLNNITMELVSETAQGSVVDIIVANVSTADATQVDYTVHPGTPAGVYHVRMNGTIFNGNTKLSTTSAISNSFSLDASDDPCAAGTFTPVSSPADPTYRPLRFTPQEGGDVSVLTQAEITGPSSSISFTLDRVDMDAINPTVEVLNTVTGFSTVQTPQFRVNFTNNNPLYPGKYSVVSDTFYVIAASGQPSCNVTSAPTASAPGAGPGPTISSAPGTAPVQSGPATTGEASTSDSGAGPAESGHASSPKSAANVRGDYNLISSWGVCVFIWLLFSGNL